MFQARCSEDVSRNAKGRFPRAQGRETFGQRRFTGPQWSRILITSLSSILFISHQFCAARVGQALTAAANGTSCNDIDLRGQRLSEAFVITNSAKACCKSPESSLAA